MKKLLLLILSISLNPLAHAMQKPKDLIQAAKDGDVARVRVLISTLNRIEKLINKEAYLNQTDDADQTPLIWAAYNGHLPVVKELLAAGADVNAQSNGGYTPLMNALAGKHPEIAKELMQAENIDLNIQNDNGWTALAYAIDNKTFHDVAQELLQDKNFDPQVQKGALLNASAGGFVKFVKALIWLNCDIDYINFPGDNSLMVAMRNNPKELSDVAKALLTEFSKKDAERIIKLISTIRLSLAPLKERLPQPPLLKDIIYYLIQSHVMPDLVEERLERARKTMSIKNKDGLTAQEIAKQYEHPAMAALLDPNNQDSQNELRELIKKNIYAILKKSHEEALEAEKSKN